MTAGLAPPRRRSMRALPRPKIPTDLIGQFIRSNYHRAAPFPLPPLILYLVTWARCQCKAPFASEVFQPDFRAAANEIANLHNTIGSGGL